MWYEEKCREKGLDTLETRRTRQDLLQAYKIFSGKDRIKYDSLFTTTGANSTRQTRFTIDPLNIVEKRSRLDVRKNSYAVRVADNWNKLSHEVKTSRSVPVFKNAITSTVYTGRAVEGHIPWPASYHARRAYHEPVQTSPKCLYWRRRSHRLKYK